jgi:hypothetical protein
MNPIFAAVIRGLPCDKKFSSTHQYLPFAVPASGS